MIDNIYFIIPNPNQQIFALHSLMHNRIDYLCYLFIAV